jgi:putative spermidine/putrescine transport system ATP-binding protein
LDEPLSALDAKVRVSLRAEIRRIQSELGLTTIYVTHDQEEALSISDRVVVMREGGIEQDGSPKEIYRQPASRFVADFIGTANQFEGAAIDNGTVQTKSFVIKAQIPEALIKKEIVVLVRPENIRLVDNPLSVPSTENIITGRIESISFMGPITRVVVAANGRHLMCDISATQHSQLEFNQEISLAFSPEVCQVMQA